MSATPDVMNTLPKILQEYFPFVLRGKSGYTKTLADFIEVQLKQGVNSLKISEGIASLAIREFCKELFAEANEDSRLDSYKIGMSQFYKNSLFSYPSNDTLMNMFLKSFKARSHWYEENMSNLNAEVITCDHTIKVSRKIGVVREGDNKFLSQYNQIFIVLNQKGEVHGWKLTKLTTFCEVVRHLLLSLGKRAIAWQPGPSQKQAKVPAVFSLVSGVVCVRNWKIWNFSK